ncbi:MAG: hypothetical protein RIQ46_1004 [Pseudomonadota bacterium]
MREGAEPPEAPPALEDQPATPLADEGFTLAWPEAEPALAEAAEPLEPEADLAEAAAALPSEAERPAGEERRLSSRVTLVWSGAEADFPERKAFEARFEQLSSIEQFAGQGDGGAAQVAVRARTDTVLLQRLLRNYGFYDAEVTQRIAPDGAGDGGTAFLIAPGVRYRFGAIALGELAATGADSIALRGALGLAGGDPVSADAIVAGRQRLDAALGEAGYAFAKVGDPQLTVDHRREQADLDLPVTPGGKYVFGPVTSARPRFLSSRHLQDIARFGPGDPWKDSEVDDLRRAILATGLVASVAVTPRETRPPAEGQPGEVALDIAMEKARLRTIAGALGYDSGDGPRAEVSWEHRNLFPPEGMLRLRGVAGTREQLVGATFRRNNFKGRDQILTADLYANTVQRDAYGTRTVAFAGSFEKVTTLLFQKPWTWSAGVELVASSEREGRLKGVITPRQTYLTVALPLRAAFDGSDDLLDPSRGVRAALRISPEVSQRGGNGVTYARIQADASLYQPAGKRVVMAARVRLGSMPGAALADIAPSRRFYAGGGGSVRGFGYQQIGPRDMVGDPSGGRSLAEFSLEARVKTGLLGGALALVPFLDAGAVDEGVTPRLRDVRYGAGLGFRYQTGFGPIRVDVGTPLDRRRGEGRIGVYVALGQAF